MLDIKRLGHSIAGLAAFGLLWWAAVALFDIPAFLLPSPWALIPKLRFLAEDANLARHLATTLGEILAGFACGAVAGVAAGVAFAASPRLERLATPLVLLVQTAPKTALAPLLVLWLGLGAAPKIVLVAAVVFFPALAGTLAGLRAIAAPWRDLAAVLCLSRAQRLRWIALPAALPPILAALRVATTLAVTAAVVGELMGANRGLGTLLAMGQENADAGIVLAVVVVLCVVGWALHAIVAALERALPGATASAPAPST